jgi:signal transduction histidine kinase
MTKSLGLKIRISVQLAILLGIAMILVVFVMVISVQKILLDSEVRKGYLFLSAVQNSLKTISESRQQIPISAVRDNVNSLFRELYGDAGISCLIFIAPDSDDPLYFGGAGCALHEELIISCEALIRESLRSGEKMSRSFGTIWGIFWKQRQYMILASPLFLKQEKAGGAGVILGLEGIYILLRRAQQVLFVYMFINTLVLTMIGVSRLSKITVKPLHKLLKRAEEFQEDSDIFLVSEKENNEFSQLSKALNRMVKRISEDKAALRSSVLSLEKANRDLKQAQAEMIRAEKLASVGRLSAGIAHEIGNPIAIVTGYLDLIRREDISAEEKADFISRAEKEISRISSIIRQLLDFSRSPYSGTEGGAKVVSVHEIIRDMADMLSFQPLTANIAIELSLSAEKDTVLADSNQLRQVFLNLAINATDALRSVGDTRDGKLVIKSEIESDNNVSSMLKLEFTDNGPGIPAAHLSDIFDPFYTTKDPGKGTGLGLSVCFTIIESLGGSISAFSEEGKGTSMIIRLPVCDNGIAPEC